ncbi:hypothetical protein PLICRDRAFT_695030 [Plicaturopsis crispa FD-325 SS-3]|nr:hypothetical protein PLICRDRAFT_695030 [Plicaturopsis crispa FD-325 SS-3]
MRIFSIPSTIVLACAARGIAAVTVSSSASENGIQPSTYTVPGAFPTSAYDKYYNSPTATDAQVQPVISDPVSHKTYPLALTNPDAIPSNNTVDVHPLPPVASSSRLLSQAAAQIVSIATNPIFGNNTCAQCQAALEVAKFLALAAPHEGPALIVQMCEHFAFSSSCATTYGPLGLGNILTQVISNADAGGYDGQNLCYNFIKKCPRPATSPLNLTSWFAKPKPDPLPAPPKRSGKRVKVLHLSDIHLDPRYATGAEANCTSGLCCRSNNFNKLSPNETLLAAPRFGSFLCDSPLSLVMSALEAIPTLTGTKDQGFAWTLYTGDLLAHEPDNQNSRDLVTYTETALYNLFKSVLGSGPVYTVLGNHDSYNQAQDASHSLGEKLGQQFSWNYDHLASLWKHEDWLPEAAVDLARAHYGAYMVKRVDGLRIITLNTDLWYRANYFNYINMTDPDVSGMLRFVTDELQDAEDAGDRVWILGHVLSGWDGTNPLLNPSNLFYQIVDRFSHIIANLFWAHTHEDQVSVYYANNATNISAESAGAVGWIGPSITPTSNVNSGFRVYEIDSATFEIMDAHTWKSDVSAFPSLDSQTAAGPTYAYEYSTREAYGGNVTGWSESDPLNATWWHHVTEAMVADPSLVTKFHAYQGKSSVRTAACNATCIEAKICYIRSGSAPLGIQNCIPGYGSVQGLYD